MARAVLLARRLFPPGSECLQNRAFHTPQLFIAGDPLPSACRWVAVEGRIDKYGKPFLEPSKPIQTPKLFIQVTVDLNQITDIIKRIAHLFSGQGPSGPIGTCIRLLEFDPQDLLHQPSIADLIRITEQGSG